MEAPVPPPSSCSSSSEASQSTTKIVFACNSNSCRSQMAEAWARRWLVDHDLMDHPVVVASVALDADAVGVDDDDENKHHEKKVRDHHDHHDDDDDDDDDRPSRPRRRRPVKAKAMAAVEKQFGVDEGRPRAVPKTWSELWPVVASARSQRDADARARAFLGDDVAPAVGTKGASARAVAIDRLVVLCRCGGEDGTRRELGRSSALVEEWDVDAPTASSRAGEGDEAYARVSLEIKHRVHDLMDSLDLRNVPRSS